MAALARGVDDDHVRLGGLATGRCDEAGDNFLRGTGVKAGIGDAI